MTPNDEIESAIARVLEAATPNFVELVTISGLDPASDFRHANLNGIDFADSNLSGFDFIGTSFDGATFVNSKISGAKFSRSPKLDSLLIHAIDADEVFRARRRRRRRGGKRDTGAAPFIGEGEQVNPQTQSDERSDLPRFLLKPVAISMNDVGESSPEPANLAEALLWLDRNPDAKSAAFAIRRLVSLSNDREEVARRARIWLGTNCETIEASIVLTVLLEQSNRYPFVEEYSLRWLDRFPAVSSTANVLRLLLRVSSSNEVVVRTLNWLEANSNDLGGVASVLDALVLAHGHNKVVKERALQWIEDRISPKARGNLLVKLLNANRDDESIREHCLAFIDQSPTARSNVELLIVLLRRTKCDDQLKKRLFLWLDHNWTWHHTLTVIDHLARCNDSGEDASGYVRKWVVTYSAHKNFPTSLRNLTMQEK